MTQNKNLLKKAPEVMPTDTRELYAFLAHPEYYEGESTEDFTSRQNLREHFENQLLDANLTIDELAAMNSGIILDKPKKASLASPLMQNLMGRI